MGVTARGATGILLMPEPEKTHTVEDVKPEPVKVTVVEPRRLPLVGEMEVTTEEGTTWY